MYSSNIWFNKNFVDGKKSYMGLKMHERDILLDYLIDLLIKGFKKGFKDQLISRAICMHEGINECTYFWLGFGF